MFHCRTKSHQCHHWNRLSWSYCDLCQHLCYILYASLRPNSYGHHLTNKRQLRRIPLWCLYRRRWSITNGIGGYRLISNYSRPSLGFYPFDAVSIEAALDLVANTKAVCFIRTSRVRLSFTETISHPISEKLRWSSDQWDSSGLLQKTFSTIR